MSDGIWVLTREINDYNQDGEYFVDAWVGKPSAAQLKAHINYDDEVTKCLDEGGGRVDFHGQWYWLRTVDQSREPIRE